jgi:hypothetical protein
MAITRLVGVSGDLNSQAPSEKWEASRISRRDIWVDVLE